MVSADNSWQEYNEMFSPQIHNHHLLFELPVWPIFFVNWIAWRWLRRCRLRAWTRFRSRLWTWLFWSWIWHLWFELYCRGIIRAIRSSNSESVNKGWNGNGSHEAQQLSSCSTCNLCWVEDKAIRFYVSLAEWQGVKVVSEGYQYPHHSDLLGYRRYCC